MIPSQREKLTEKAPKAFLLRGLSRKDGSLDSHHNPEPRAGQAGGRSGPAGGGSQPGGAAVHPARRQGRRRGQGAAGHGGPGLRDRVPGRRGGQRLQRFSVPGGHRERLCPHRGLHPHQSSDFRRGRRAHRAARAGALRHVGRMGRPAGCSGQPPAPLRGRRPVRQRAGAVSPPPWRSRCCAA